MVFSVLLLAAATSQGCCCDNGIARLSRVEVTTEKCGVTDVPFDGSSIDFPQNAFFTAFRVGSPDAGQLRTIPLLQLYDESDVLIPLQRFTAFNDGGCAIAEIYEPADDALVLGASYKLVHSASASPGVLEDSGVDEGALAPFIQDYRGDAALVASLTATEAIGRGGGGGVSAQCNAADSGAGGSGGAGGAAGGAGGGGGQ